MSFSQLSIKRVHRSCYFAGKACLKLLQAQCTEAGQRLTFQEVLEDMGKSMFCLILPDLGQSTRTLSEAMLAGESPEQRV